MRYGKRWSAAFAIAAMLAVGCGQAGSSVVTVDSLEAVAAATDQAQTARFEIRMDITIAGTTATMVGEGTADSATGNAQFTMRGEGEHAQQLGTSETRIVDGDMYVRGPMAGQYAPGTVVPQDSWIRLDADTLAAMQGAGQTNMVDFDQTLDLMRAVGSDVEELGTQEIRGMTLKGFRGTTTTRAMLEQQGISEQQFIEATLAAPAVQQAPFDAERMARAMLDLEQTIEVWVDDERLPRRVVIEPGDIGEALEGLPQAEQLGEISFVMQYDVLEYGLDVNVEAPPADQVVSAS